MTRTATGQGFGAIAVLATRKTEQRRGCSRTVRLNTPPNNTEHFANINRTMSEFEPLIQSLHSEKTYSAKAIADAVNKKLGDGASISDATIRTRWTKPIGKAIGVRRIKRGGSYSAAYMEACLLYSLRCDRFPDANVVEAGKLWVAEVKDALANVAIEPEVLDGDEFPSETEGHDEMSVPAGRDAVLGGALAPLSFYGGSSAMTRRSRQSNRTAAMGFDGTMDVVSGSNDAHEQWLQQKLAAAEARGRMQAAAEFHVEQQAAAQHLDALRRGADEVVVGNDPA